MGSDEDGRWNDKVWSASRKYRISISPARMVTRPLPSVCVCGGGGGAVTPSGSCFL